MEGVTRQPWQIRLRLRLLVGYDTRWNAWVRDFTAWLERPYWPFAVWRRWPYGYPHEDGGMVVIGPECHASDDCAVISWRGENYYRDSIPEELPILEED